MLAPRDDNVGPCVPVLAGARVNISHGNTVKLQDVGFPKFYGTQSVDEIVDVPELIDAVARLEAGLVFR
jgi:hypothetical protein